MVERIPHTDLVFKCHWTNSQIRGHSVPSISAFSFSEDIFENFSPSAIPMIMAATSNMSEVKMRQLYCNGCYILQPLKVFFHPSVPKRKNTCTWTWTKTVTCSQAGCVLSNVSRMGVLAATHPVHMGFWRGKNKPKAILSWPRSACHAR